MYTYDYIYIYIYIYTHTYKQVKTIKHTKYKTNRLDNIYTYVYQNNFGSTCT